MFNPAYGFRILIPPTLTGRDVDNPLYQRGFILLFSDPDESLNIQADTNSLDGNTLSQAAAEYTRAYTDQAKSILSYRSNNIVLGRRAAIEVSTSFLCRGTPGVFSLVTILTLSPDRRFLYTLNWTGREDRRDAGTKLLRQLVRSWRFMKPTS